MNAYLCNDDRLRVLLSDEEQSAEFRAAARHVETCAACQQRLTTLAGDEVEWSEAKNLLDCDEPRWNAGDTHTLLQSAIPNPQSAIDPAALRHLLAAPTHPELLGRLGRYDVERVIGSGGMGIVLKAHDSELNRPVAVKVLASHLAHSGPARERFAREGRAAAAVVHEHVVAIYNVESDGAVPFLVMQYVPGRSLQTRVDEDGPLGVEQILRIGVQAAAGLAAAHRQGLVHRDVKPSNILLEDTVERAVLTDFGLARAMDDASLTQTGIVAGTPHYMSPEQASGGPIDHRSDLFSLGSVLYFMATGRPPFRATGSLAVLNRICREPHRPVWKSHPEMPDELCDVIDRLLEKKPSRRFASADEVSHTLAELLSRAQQRGLGRRRLRIGRKWHWKAAALSATVLAATFVAIATWGGGDQQPPTSDQETPQVTADSSAAAAQSKSPPEPLSPLDRQRIQELSSAEQDFAVSLGTVRGALAGAGGDSVYLQFGDDRWHNEVQEIDRQLKELEAGRVLSR